MIVDLQEYKAKKYGVIAKKGKTSEIPKRTFLELKYLDADGKEQERTFDSAMDFVRAAGEDSSSMPVNATVMWARFLEDDGNIWEDATVGELALRCKQVLSF